MKKYFLNIANVSFRLEFFARSKTFNFSHSIFEQKKYKYIKSKIKFTKKTSTINQNVVNTPKIKRKTKWKANFFTTG